MDKCMLFLLKDSGSVSGMTQLDPSTSLGMTPQELGMTLLQFGMTIFQQPYFPL